MTERLKSEQDFHDRQARERAAALANSNLHFSDDFYLDHETWIRPAIDRLALSPGKTVLDYGCGHGMAAVVLARSGARVVAFDLSHEYVAEAGRRAEANGVALSLLQADGARLPFADGVFDRIWGNAILHHIPLAEAARELHRVLKPGGRAVFCEPFGENRLLQFARRWLPYPGKMRTPDEEPLRRRDLAAFDEVFADVEVLGYQLLSMVRRAVRAPLLVRWLTSLDSLLLRIIPGLRYQCRYVVLVLRRE